MHELGIVFHIINSLESVGREKLRRSGFLFERLLEMGI